MRQNYGGLTFKTDSDILKNKNIIGRNIASTYLQI